MFGPSVLKGILEQVVGFSRLSTTGTFPETSPLDSFIARLRGIQDSDGAQLYTGIEAMEVDLAAWVDVSRPRTGHHLLQGSRSITHSRLMSE